jgi:hypothetical protein
MIVVLWRAGLRVQEALALAEHDLDPRRGSLLVRNGKGGRRREVGMDDWAGSTYADGSAVNLSTPPGGEAAGAGWASAGLLGSGMTVRSLETFKIPVAGAPVNYATTSAGYRRRRW